MLSALSAYQIYSQDLPRTRERIAGEGANKADADYYARTIPTISSIDAFMDDYRLYSYAMTAHGLEDQMESRGLIRRVLESDPGDRSSLVNRLEDGRYKALAEAFDFRTVERETALQTGDQKDMVVEGYSESRTRQARSIAADNAYFREAIQSVETVDDLLSNTRLFSIVRDTFGFGRYTTPESLRSAFTEPVDGSSPGNAKTYRLQQYLLFEPDGTAPAGGLIDAADAERLAYGRYENAGLTGSAPASALNADYYEATIATIDSADALTQDPRLFEMALTAVGLDPSVESEAFAAQVLSIDPQDPDNVLDTMSEATPAEARRKAQFRALYEAYAFNPDGTVGGEGAQTAAMRETTVEAYLDNAGDDRSRQNRIDKALFEAGSNAIETASQFVDIDSVYTYALKAFDLDPAQESKLDIIRVLKSDLSDPDSFARRLGDQRYIDLAGAFNFDARGRLAPQRIVQSETQRTDIAERYLDRLGDDPADYRVERANARTRDYTAALARVYSLESFLRNDTVLDYALEAFDLADERPSDETIRRLLTSDLADPESFANTRGDERYVDFAAAFSFTPEGRIDPGRSIGAQSGRDLLTTQDLFLRQKIEADAGDLNQGARLALFFKRSITEVQNGYDLIANPRMMDVISTALGLPETFGQADVDRQAATLEARLDLDGLKTDEATRERFVRRFLALYDTQTGGGTGPNPALSILGGSGLIGFI